MLPPDFYERSLLQEWHTINTSIFGGSLLTPPTVRIDDDIVYRAAEWDVDRRCIRFSRAFVEGHAWPVITEVLKHEMAHQYVSDVLGVDDEPAHGPAFRHVCARYAIDPRASGVAGSSADTHILDKVRKLFALGDALRNDSEAEAASALRRAQELLAKHRLTEGDVTRRGEADEYGAIFVGEVFTRIPAEHDAIGTILAKFYRVACCWIWTMGRDGQRGRMLELCGRRSDLVIAQHVHGFLVAECERRSDQKGITGARARSSYIASLLVGLQSSLVEEEPGDAAAGEARALARVLRDEQLRDYQARRHPGMTKRTARARYYDAEAVAEGRGMTIRKPVGGTSGPKLLGR